MNDSLALSLAPDVARAARGDHAAFARVVDVTRNTVAAIALAIVRDVELSHDVAQDVYLHAWRDLRRLREPTSFLPWLRQLARNRAHHALRSQVRHRRRIDSAGDSVLEAAADPRPDALHALLDREQADAVEATLTQLPAPAREVLVLYYREGSSTAHVAALLGVSEAAVRQRLARARRVLREGVAARLRDTALGPAFTAGVIAAAASLAVPAAASAAVIGTGKAAKAGMLLPAATGAGLAGALVGLTGGLAGVLHGTRDLLRQARDERERRGVIGVGLACMIAMMVFLSAILARPTPETATAGFVFMMAVFLVAHFVWLPRVMARRWAAELEEEGAAAAARHRLFRMRARLGFGLGTLLGGSAVIASWFF